MRSILFLALVGLFAIDGGLTSPATNPHNPLLRYPDGRIIGGIDAKAGAHPYQVSLQSPVSNFHFCGGSLISDQWVLTAAHCVYGKTPAHINVLAGTIDKTDLGVEEGGIGVRIPAAELHVGEEFNSTTMYSDIALIKLQRPFELSDKIQCVKLPQEDHKDPLDVHLTGWGYTNLTTGNLPEILQYVDLTTMDTKECDSYMINWRVGKCHVCTRGVVGFGACNGDSGGPLCDENGTVRGVVSFGFPCARGLPDAYGRVSCFTDWIRRTVGEIRCGGIEN